MACLFDQNICRLRSKNRELLQQLQSNSALLQRRIRGLRQTARTPLKSDKSWDRLPPSSLKRRYESWKARNNSSGVARALTSGAFRDNSEERLLEEESIVRVVNMPPKRNKQTLPPGPKDKKTALSCKPNSRHHVTGKKQRKPCTQCYCSTPLTEAHNHDDTSLKKMGVKFTGNESAGSGDFPNELTDCLKEARHVLTYSPKSIFLRRMKQRIQMLDTKQRKESRTQGLCNCENHEGQAAENMSCEIHESTHTRNEGTNNKMTVSYLINNKSPKKILKKKDANVNWHDNHVNPQPRHKHCIDDSDESYNSEASVRSTDIGPSGDHLICKYCQSSKIQQEITEEHHPLTKDSECQNDLSDGENLEQDHAKRKPRKSVKSQAVQTLVVQQVRVKRNTNGAVKNSEQELTPEHKDQPVTKRSDEVVDKELQGDKLQTLCQNNRKASEEHLKCGSCRRCCCCCCHAHRSTSGLMHKQQFSPEVQGAGYDVIAGLVENEHEGNLVDSCPYRLQQLNKFRRDHWFDCHALPRPCCGCCAAQKREELRCSWREEDLQAQKHTCLDPLLPGHEECARGQLGKWEPAYSAPAPSTNSGRRLRREVTLPVVPRPPQRPPNTRAFPSSRLLVRDMRPTTAGATLGVVSEARPSRRQRPVPVNSLALRFQKGVA